MHFPRLPFARPTLPLTALLDIGSGSVGGALVEDVAANPTVRFTTRKSFPFSLEVSAESLERAMLAALFVVARRLEEAVRSLERDEERRAAVGEAVAVFSSPWYAGKTAVVRIEREAPFTVTRRIFAETVADAERSFAKPEDDALLLERSVIQTIVNGYRTSRPVGKRGATLDLALYLSALPRGVAEKARGAIGRAFPGRPVSLHSFGLVAFSALRDLFPEKDHFLLLDVSGEVTEVLLVRDGVLLENASFPLGHNFLIRRLLAARPAETAESSRSLLSLFLSGRAAPAEREKIAGALAKAGEEWQKRLEKLLANLAEGMLLPMTVFLAADAGPAAWFAERLRQPGFATLTLTQEPFSVSIIDAALSARCANFRRGATVDPFVALEGLFLKKCSASA